MRRCWFPNNDITASILSRMSAKSLHCLKLVSKEWRDLISGRSFISLQLKKTEPVSGFFFQETFQWIDIDVESISYIPVDVANVKVWRSVLDFLPERVTILSTNNGLLCCRSCSSISTIYVCNPLNKQWTSLQWAKCSRNSSVALVFEPLQNPIDVSTDFKLVALTHSEEEEEPCFFFDIYSSKTASWKRLKECCQCNQNLYKNKGVSVERILYWLTGGYQILMFDPQNEMPWLITAPLPETEFDSIPEMCIGESQGKLCYAIISEHGLQLWALEDHFTSVWELKACILLDELETGNSDSLYKISEKVGSRTCKDSPAWIDPLALKDEVLLLRVAVNVYAYQFENRRMRKLCDVSALGPKSMFFPIVVPYSMSLVPLSHAQSSCLNG